MIPWSALQYFHTHIAESDKGNSGVHFRQIKVYTVIKKAYTAIPTASTSSISLQFKIDKGDI